MNGIAVLEKRLKLMEQCNDKSCSNCLTGAPPPKKCEFRLEILMNEEDIKESK
jgi:hypothetical protein